MLFNIFDITAFGVVVAAVLVLYRAIAGPTVFDRVLAGNVFGTKTVLILILIGFSYGRPEVFIDIAIVYALINFTGVLAFLRFVKTGRLDRVK